MTAPQRIQLRNTKGWRLQEHSRALNGLSAVKVDRTSKWANPATVVKDKIVGTECEDENGEEILEGPWLCAIQRGRRAGWWFSTKYDATEKAVEYFRYLTTESPGKDGWSFRIRELRGKNLACWCGLDEPCDADVLLELANR